MTWIHNKLFSVNGASIVWKGFINIITWIGRGLIWMVGDGKNTKIGLDPIVGMDSSFLLPKDLRDYLEDYGITSLIHVRNHAQGASSYWLTASDLDLGGDWQFIWNNYIKGLDLGRIRLGSNPDSMLWEYKNHTGSLTGAIAYDSVVESFAGCQCGISPTH